MILVYGGDPNHGKLETPAPAYALISPNPPREAHFRSNMAA